MVFFYFRVLQVCGAQMASPAAARGVVKERKMTPGTYVFQDGGTGKESSWRRVCAFCARGGGGVDSLENSPILTQPSKFFGETAVVRRAFWGSFFCLSEMGKKRGGHTNNSTPQTNFAPKISLHSLSNTHTYTRTRVFAHHVGHALDSPETHARGLSLSLVRHSAEQRSPLATSPAPLLSICFFFPPLLSHSSACGGGGGSGNKSFIRYASFPLK